MADGRMAFVFTFYLGITPRMFLLVYINAEKLLLSSELCIRLKSHLKQLPFKKVLIYRVCTE